MLQSLILQHPPNTTTTMINTTNTSTNTSKRTITTGEGEEDDSSPSHLHKRRNLEENDDNNNNNKSLIDEKEQNDIIEAESSGLKLLGLLLQCAECIAVDNLDHANNLLPEITERASPFGTSPERVAAYFAEALQSRIITSYLGTYTPLTTITKLTQTQNQKICTALQSYNSITPFIKFSHFTANQAIFQALENEDTVHIIDLDIMQGLQWPGLFHILASRPRKLKSIKITGVGASIELLQSTGTRLHDFANRLSLPFHFVPYQGKIGNLRNFSELETSLGIQPGEPVIVHWMHHCLYDVTGSDYEALRLLHMMKPKLLTIIEQDLSHGGSFLRRFVEALHYYSALFDAVGDGVETENFERHTVENELFGCEIKNIVAVGGPKRTGEVKVEKWGEELGRVGFSRVSLAGNPAAQAGLLLGMFPWKGYTLVEENGCLKLGWKDLSLLTASAWQPSHFD